MRGKLFHKTFLKNVLAVREGVTALDISYEVDTTYSYTSTIIKYLESKGYLTRGRDGRRRPIQVHPPLLVLQQKLKILLNDL